MEQDAATAAGGSGGGSTSGIGGCPSSSDGSGPPAPQSAAEQAWADRQQERIRALKKVREDEKKALKASGVESSKQRLAYLMKQADIFAHFVNASSGGATSSLADATASSSSGEAAGKDEKEGRRGKGRMSEKAEDDAMLRDAGTEDTAKDEYGGTRLTAQPKCIAFGKMRAYQLEGLNWLIKLHEQGINGILADEMGLGKTLQTISLLGYLKEARSISGPHLIITPKSTLTNWANECARWCPSLRVVKFQGDKHVRAKLKAEFIDVHDNFDVW